MRRTTLLGVIAAALLAAGLATSAAQGATGRTPRLTQAKPDALTLALHRGALTPGQYALQRALSVFRYDDVAARYGVVARPGPRDATLLLLDLAVRRHELSGRDRALADELLARPADPRYARPDDGQDPTEQHYSTDALTNYFYTCAATFCVNWVTTTSDAPDLTDADGDGIPDYVDAVAVTMQQVWDTEVATLGFRAPKSDANTTANPFNENGLLDVYLVDLGGAQSGLYGYCSTDDPNVSPSYPGYDLSAFCVFDNDYSPSEYPQSAPLAALQATVAHEFAHASQFAYNYSQDRWFMEATATWMEEQVFDDVNDNVQYLPDSALMNPGVPLDLNAYEGDLSLFKYGNWAFFQLLSEGLGPEIVRRTWEQSDGAPGGPNLVSTYALEAALEERGSSVAEAFANFGAASVWPPAFYEEGSTWVFTDSRGRQFQAAAPLPRAVKLSPRKRHAGARALVLDHLTTGYATFAPGKGTRKSARLQVAVDLPDAELGSEATIVTLARNGRVGFYPISLDAAGDGGRTVPFGKMSAVVVVLSNGSHYMDACGTASGGSVVFPCGGVPMDDGLSFAYDARLIG